MFLKYSLCNKAPKIELFAKIVNGFQPLAVLTKSLSNVFDRVLNTPLYLIKYGKIKNSKNTEFNFFKQYVNIKTFQVLH